MNRNTRIGLRLFFVYLVLYGAFVLTNAFAADWMEYTLFAGVNVAILSGVGLIIIALLLALAYGWMCDPDAESSPNQEVDE